MLMFSKQVTQSKHGRINWQVVIVFPMWFVAYPVLSSISFFVLFGFL